MTKLSLFALLLLSLTSITHAVGSSSTLAVTNGPTVCGLVSSAPTRAITCYSNSHLVPALPNVSFSAVSGGRDFLCGLRSGGYAFICWNTSNSSSLAYPRRVYFNTSALVESFTVGDDQICATLNDNSLAPNATTGTVKCWRGDGVRNPTGSARFRSISSGARFSCGILAENQTIRCWGSDRDKATEIQSGFANATMESITCGGSHACGFDSGGLLVCKGDNSSGQLNVPNGAFPFEYSQVSLGSNHTCGVRGVNGSVICWGGSFGSNYDNVTEGVHFESIVSDSNFTCGIMSENLSVACWGPGWPGSGNSGLTIVPFTDPILPGPCVEKSFCNGCGVKSDSDRLCSGSGVICQPCSMNVLAIPPSPVAFPCPPPHPSSSSSKALTTALLVFAIIGSIGAFSGTCAIIYCLWTGTGLGKMKVHNSVQPTIARGGSNNNGTSSGNNSGNIVYWSSTTGRQGSRAMRRQRSGTSSKHAGAEQFHLAELVAATNDFAPENKIGAGSFGIVYKGKLRDGREVAIKRGEVGNSKAKKFKEKESAFESELAFLSRVHHKHLVRLVGYCEEGDERLLVYEYMKNGTLHDHLHDKDNLEKSSSVINSWKMRIKIALDAARGIEYLHNYAVPSIIHRDIKSSNILIDASWTARVSDFGLSMMGPELEGGGQYRSMKAAGTVGYIDPENYGLNVLTAKSDVYGFGVVLLEIITGMKAIFTNDDDDDDDDGGGGMPTSLVDFAVPMIMANELVKILDRRVGPPGINEAEAVELVANTAMHCVQLDGRERPTMTDIVYNLERAFSLCDDGSHGSISSNGIISSVSD